MSDKVKTDLPFSIVPRWVSRHPDLTAQAIRVYTVLADYADGNGRAFPARPTLAKACGGMGVNTIDRALALLLKHSVISVEQRFGHSSMFTVHLSPPEGVSPRVVVGVPTGGDTDVPTGGEHNKNHLNKNHKQEDVPAFPKEQTKPMFTAFCEVFGTPISTMRAAYGKTVNEALEAGITPDQIGPAARRYRQGWDGVACTPMALLKHWNTWGPEAAERARRDQMPAEVRAAYEGTG